MEHKTCVRPKKRTPEEKELMKVFSRPPHERSLECITKCIPILKKIKFFSQREIDDEEYMEIRNIMYEEGSFGREFHLIIMGKVTVCIKDPSK